MRPNLAFLLNFDAYQSIDILKQFYEPGRFSNAQVRRKHHGSHHFKMAQKAGRQSGAG